MTLTFELVLFAFFIFVLASMRRRLLYELQATGLLLFNSPQAGLAVYSIFVLPGTILHELSHWIVAEILLVRTGQITLIPSSGFGNTAERTLGSVETAHSGPFRGFAIGIAPFITGISVLLLLGYLLDLGWGVYPWWSVVLIIYGIVVTGSSMMISREDRHYLPFMLILVTVLGVGLSLADISLTPSFLAGASSVIGKINLSLGLTSGLTLGMILGLYLVRRILEKITKKRVIKDRSKL